MTRKPPATGTQEQQETETVPALGFPWNVIVWDDPINLMSYVVYVFQKLFGFSQELATKHMLEVHNDGRSVVATVDRERGEFYVSRLHGYGLQATLERPSGKPKALGARATMARIKPAEGPPAGRWILELPPLEASLVAKLPERLAAVLKDPDGNRRIIDRLFPSSYSDPAEQREHRRLLGSSLLQDRQQMLADVRVALAAAPRTSQGLELPLDAATLDLLLHFINDVRLLLATELGIDKNLDQLTVAPTDKDAPKYTLLVYLGGLEALMVEAVAGG